MDEKTEIEVEETTKTSNDILDEIISEAEKIIGKEEKNNEKDKKTIQKRIIITVVSLFIICIAVVCSVLLNGKTTVEEKEDLILPLPELSGGERGQLGIDKNINEATIDKYLNRPDTVYRDLRMLEDPANYEGIGGDRFLSGYIEGFEIVSLPYIIPVTDLPEEVGETYIGKTLFRESEGTFLPNFEESLNIIETLFPKNKNIFLMCGGGGYAGMMKKFLIALGYDQNKIYNVGGYWYYHGNHNINITKEVNGKLEYDFDSLPYHEINFDALHLLPTYQFQALKLEEVKITEPKIEIMEGKSYVLTYVRLPAGSAYTDVTWESSDPNVATVSEWGLVVGKGAGTATITITTQDDNHFTSTCTVVVKPRPIIDPIELDDISEEAKEFKLHDLQKIQNDFYDKVYDEGGYKEGYYYLTPEGYKRANSLYEKENEIKDQKLDDAYKNRLRIIDGLVDKNKSFIILQDTRVCGYKEFTVFESAMKILDSYKLPYLLIYHEGSNDAFNGKLDFENNDYSSSSILIVKNGQIFDYLDPNAYSFENDDEVEEWLKMYVKLTKEEPTTTTTTAITTETEDEE